jgi:hypothetical protein
MKLLAGRHMDSFELAFKVMIVQSHDKNNERDTDNRYIISPSGQRYYTTELCKMKVC